jgi:hypothetical protein
MTRITVSHLQRKVFFACGLIVASLLMLSATATVAPENALAATTYTTAGGGSCYYQGTTMTIKTGTAQFPMSTTTLVKKWVRLVDVNGNGQTGWFYVGSAWASPGSPANFGPSGISRGQWNAYSRIQSDYQFYVGGAYRSDLNVTTTAYTKWVLLNVFGGGTSWQQSASGNSCFW